MTQRIYHPSRPRGPAAGPQRRGPLARQLCHRPPGEIGVWQGPRSTVVGGSARRRWDVVRVRAGVAGLAAVLGICGCATAGFSHVPVAQRHVTRASSAAPGALAAASSAAPSARPAAGGQWRRVFGPWIAWIGRNGMAPPGAKREGDGRTPSGTFGFGFFFGVDPDPGVHFPYRRVHAYDVWDDDSSSPLYNEWLDDRYADPGADPEPMDVSAYDYGAVIGYNTARTPGLGSAIFLHLNIGMPTAGCVTLPTGELLEILRWLNPAASPRITIGARTAGTAGG
jgi:L,D-peptidoglycan transpeptidase YkuD (ErfK/YbiS/YcfS/YnhG family)